MSCAFARRSFVVRSFFLPESVLKAFVVVAAAAFIVHFIFIITSYAHLPYGPIGEEIQVNIVKTRIMHTHRFLVRMECYKNHRNIFGVFSLHSLLSFLFSLFSKRIVYQQKMKMNFECSEQT